jgi:glycosyltransferase involved in cell wall biosynthesis
MDYAADPFPAGAPDGPIAVVCHAHPSVSKGGAEIAAYTLYEGLNKLGYEALFIASVPESDRAKLALGSARERAVFFDPISYDHFYHLSTPAPLRDLRAIIAAERPAFVNFHHFMNFGIGAIRAIASDPNLTAVVTLHEFLAICHHHGQMITRPAKLLCDRSSPSACGTCFPEQTRQQFALRKNLFMDAFGSVAGFVSPSRFLAKRFTDWGLQDEAIAVIENGLAHPAVRTPPRPRHDNTPWIFGFFGQINPFKGVDTLLRAVEMIGRSKSLSRRIQIRIHGNFVGQGEAFTTRFKTMVDDYDCLSYAGPYDNASVGRLMSECDYVLMPSTWWENSPVVIQEAYAAGRPVICTGIGGMAEKIKDGVSGLHFRVGDIADLVHVLDKAAHPAMLAELTAGIPAVTDAEDMARAYLAAFSRFRAARAQPAPEVIGLPAEDDDYNSAKPQARLEA